MELHSIGDIGQPGSEHSFRIRKISGQGDSQTIQTPRFPLNYRFANAPANRAGIGPLGSTAENR